MSDINMITTDECEKCKHSCIEEINKGTIYINCILKEKRYFYGQCIPCNNFEKIEEINNENM